MTQKHGKKYTAALAKVEAEKNYALNDAVALVKEIDYANFDASVEVAFKLNVDTRQADQQLRGAVVLPNGTGKDKKVIVFAQGDKAKEAEAAGADVVGAAVGIVGCHIAAVAACRGEYITRFQCVVKCYLDI